MLAWLGRGKLADSTRISTLGLLAFLSASFYSAAPPSDTPAATYSGGTVRVSLPCEAPHSGKGQLLVEILDPDDTVIAENTATKQVHTGHNAWREELHLSKPVAIEDLAWYRLHYRFRYQGEQRAAMEHIDSISRILLYPVIHVVAQNSYLAGASAAVRVIITDSHDAPIPGTVRIDLAQSGKRPRTVVAGRLNRRGTIDARFSLPAGFSGDCSLHYIANTELGSADFTQPIHIEDKIAILLTTEKPVYQPGQTIHIRSLALDRSNHEAPAGHKLTFDLEDSRGNKVFRKVTQTDRYGVAAAEFTLADEVNLGTYHLRALLDSDDGNSTNQAELALNVERYVLPKFKVAIDLSGKRGATKRGYRPGDHVTGIVRRQLFFRQAGGSF